MALVSNVVVSEALSHRLVHLLAEGRIAQEPVKLFLFAFLLLRRRDILPIVEAINGDLLQLCDDLRIYAGRWVLLRLILC